MLSREFSYCSLAKHTVLEDMVCITKMLFLLQLGVVIFYSEISPVFSKYALRRKFYFYINITFQVAIYLVKYSEMTQYYLRCSKSLGNHPLCSHRTYDEMHHYYSISNDRSKILSYLLSSYGKLMKETDSVE